VWSTANQDSPLGWVNPSILVPHCGPEHKPWFPDVVHSTNLVPPCGQEYQHRLSVLVTTPIWFSGMVHSQPWFPAGGGSHHQPLFPTVGHNTNHGSWCGPQHQPRFPAVGHSIYQVPHCGQQYKPWLPAVGHSTNPGSLLLVKKAVGHSINPGSML
jgi:hypothetical protein